MVLELFFLESFMHKKMIVNSLQIKEKNFEIFVLL